MIKPKNKPKKENTKIFDGSNQIMVWSYLPDGVYFTKGPLGIVLSHIDKFPTHHYCMLRNKRKRIGVGGKNGRRLYLSKLRDKIDPMSNPNKWNLVLVGRKKASTIKTFKRLPHTYIQELKQFDE